MRPRAEWVDKQTQDDDNRAQTVHAMWPTRPAIQRPPPRPPSTAPCWPTALTAPTPAQAKRFGIKLAVTLQANEYFREFRQGDVSMERWDRMRSTGDRLKEALGFVYF